MCGFGEGNLQYKVSRLSLFEWVWNLDSTNGRMPIGWQLHLIRVFISQCAVSLTVGSENHSYAYTKIDSGGTCAMEIKKKNAVGHASIFCLEIFVLLL